MLLADDQADVMDMLGYAFAAYGSFEVVGRASDGRQAVDLARTAQPDVAVMDLMMPVLSGFEAMAEIRRESPGVRIAVLSAVDDLATRMRAEDAGADVFLVKGVPPREIADRLAELVARQRVTR